MGSWASQFPSGLHCSLLASPLTQFLIQWGCKGEEGAPAIDSCGLPSPDNLPNPEDRKNYELLCGDNTRKSVDDYHECYLAKVPSHAVVARTVGGKEDVIWELLNHAQVSNPLSSLLLSSPCLDLGISFTPSQPLWKSFCVQDIAGTMPHTIHLHEDTHPVKPSWSCT